MARLRTRIRWQFWLDIQKDDELLLSDELELLKSKRQWQPTVRKALRVFLALMRGDVTPLIEAFPWVVDHIVKNYCGTVQSPSNQQFEAMMHAIQALQAPPVPMPEPETSALPSLFVEADDIHEDPAEARATCAAGFGDLFGDDEEELWDD